MALASVTVYGAFVNFFPQRVTVQLDVPFVHMPSGTTLFHVSGEQATWRWPWQDVPLLDQIVFERHAGNASASSPQQIVFVLDNEAGLYRSPELDLPIDGKLSASQREAYEELVRAMIRDSSAAQAETPWTRISDGLVEQPLNGISLLYKSRTMSGIGGFVGGSSSHWEASGMVSIDRHTIISPDTLWTCSFALIFLVGLVLYVRRRFNNRRLPPLRAPSH